MASPPVPEARALLMGVAGRSEAAMAAGDSPSSALDLSRDLASMAEALAVRGWMPDAVVVVPRAVDPVADLHRLAAEVGPGARVFVHISGHGTRIPDDNGDESDGLDEALVLPDGTLLRDDVWSQAVGELAQALGPAGHVVVSLDTCHSGGMTRGLSAGAQARGTGPATLGGDGPFSDPLPPGAAPVTVLAAARPDELALEQADGGGAYTHALARALVRGHASWSGVFADLQALLVESAPGQHPQAHGELDFSVDGSVDLPRGLPIDGVLSDGRLRVVGGRLMGMSSDSQFSVVLTDGRELPATVDTVSDARVLLRVVADPTTDFSGARVVVVHSARAPLDVQVDGELPEAWQLALSRVGVAVAPSVLRLEADPQSVRLVGHGGTLAVDPADTPPDGSRVVGELRRRSAAAHLAGLELAGPGDVHIDLVTVDPATCAPLDVVPRDATGELLLPPDATVTVRLTHDGPATRALQLVHFDADGIATPLTPSGEPLRMDPGSSWTAPGCWRTVPPFGTERIKAFATRQPVDLHAFLAPSGTRTVPSWTASGLTRTLTFSVSPVLRATASRP